METHPLLKLGRSGLVIAAVLFLPWAWIAGVPVADVARIMVILFGAMLYLKLQSPRLLISVKSVVLILTAFLAALLLGLFTYQTIILSTGQTGLDFAIYTQVVHNWATSGSPISTLIDDAPRNFLTHRFAPILVVPSGLMFSGLDAGTAMILFHTACFGFAMVACLGFSRSRGLPDALAALVTVLLFCNPTIRHTIFFDVHDEVFALPLIAFAWWMWREQHHGLTVLALVLATLTKESMFAVVVGFGVMMWIDQRKNSGGPSTPVLLGLIAYGVSGFIAYFFLQPVFLHKAFDHNSKLASLTEFMRLDWLEQKLIFTMFLLLPFLAIPIWKRRYWHLILPALPLIGIVWVSRFPEMWKLLNYYGVVPSLIMGLATVDICARERWFDKTNVLLLLALSMTLAFSFSERRPTKEILKALRTPPLGNLSFIPAQSKVIASPGAIAHLFHVHDIQSLGRASQLQTTPEFDFIVTRENEEHEIPNALKEKSQKCQNSLWLIRCAK